MTQVIEARHVVPRDVAADRVAASSVVVLVTAAVGVGTVAGVAGLLAEHLVDSPVWVSVFHRLTPWVLVTLGVGFALRGRLRVTWLAGLATQLGLVASYYVAEAALTGRPLDVRSSVAYALLALVAGPLFGLTGALLEAASSLPRTLGVAAAVGVLLADGVRVIVAVASIGVHVVPSLLVGTAFIVAGIVSALVVARSRRNLCAILAGGVVFCGLVILGLDVLLA